MIVRLATAADADAIARVQFETWRAAYTGLLPDESSASCPSAPEIRYSKVL